MENFLSSDVILYPTSRRDKAKYRNSKVNTEHNMVNIVNRAVSRSFIIEGLEMSSNNTLSTGSASIGGYYFELTTPFTIQENIVTNYYWCLSLTTDKRLSNGELVAFDDPSSAYIEEESKFMGVVFRQLETLPNLVEVSGTSNEYITYNLPIAMFDGTKWDNLVDNDNNRLYKLKYNSDDIYIDSKKSLGVYYGEQSLTNFLDNNMVIDDGEI